MPSQHRGSDSAQTAPIYTVHPADDRGNLNYGFRMSHPQEPPPKYEDVISGEYLKWNHMSYDPSHSTSDQLADVTSTCTCPHRQIIRLQDSSAHSEPSPEQNNKENKCNAAGPLICVLIVTGYLIWQFSGFRN